MSLLLSHSAVWSPAIVSDADAAFRAVVQTTKEKPQTRKERGAVRIRVGEGAVVAACAASKSGTVFVGFESGKLVGYDPPQGVVLPVLTREGAIVVGIATTPYGKAAIALQGYPNVGVEMVAAWKSSAAWVPGHVYRLPPSPKYLLTAVDFDRPEAVLGLWDGQGGRLLRGVTLVPERSFDGSELGIDLETICDVVLLPPAEAVSSEMHALQPGATVIDTSASSPVPPGVYSLALLDDRDFWWSSPNDGSWHKTPLGWAVRLGGEWPPRQGSLLAREEQGWQVTVVRLGVGGRIYMARLRSVRGEWERVASAATGEAGYTTAAILGGKKFAGIRENMEPRVDCRIVDSGLTALAMIPRTGSIRQSARLRLSRFPGCDR